MKKLLVEIDTIINDEIIEYLENLEGVYRVELSDINIYVEYESSKISNKILYYEIITFLNCFNTPIILSFNKYSPKKLEKYNIRIHKLCCEYCLKINIEDLFMIEGIESASSNYDYNNNSKDVTIKIEYDKEKIQKEQIEKLEKEFDIYFYIC